MEFLRTLFEFFDWFLFCKQPIKKFKECSKKCHYPRVSPGDQPLTKSRRNYGLEICHFEGNRNLYCQVTQLHSAMIRWMITVLLRLTPDMEDKELEEINKQTDDQEVDASLGGGEILLQAIPEEICNRAQRLFAQLREFSVLLTKCCSDLVIDLMQVGMSAYFWASGH